jgi:hypothetical protein
VTDEGLRHLEGLSQLEELHLEGANITIAGVRRLERALPQTAVNHGLPTNVGSQRLREKKSRLGATGRQ